MDVTSPSSLWKCGFKADYLIYILMSIFVWSHLIWVVFNLEVSGETMTPICLIHFDSARSPFNIGGLNKIFRPSGESN